MSKDAKTSFDSKVQDSHKNVPVLAIKCKTSKHWSSPFAPLHQRLQKQSVSRLNSSVIISVLFFVENNRGDGRRSFHGSANYVLISLLNLIESDSLSCDQIR